MTHLESPLFSIIYNPFTEYLVKSEVVSFRNFIAESVLRYLSLLLFLALLKFDAIGFYL